MAAGFYDIATFSYLWLQATDIVKSIGPDLRSTPWMRPDPQNADEQVPNTRMAELLVPKIERAKEI